MAIAAAVRKRRSASKVGFAWGCILGLSIYTTAQDIGVWQVELQLTTKMGMLEDRACLCFWRLTSETESRLSNAQFIPLFIFRARGGNDMQLVLRDILEQMS